MTDIVDIATSAAGGGVFGLVGTVLGRVAGFMEGRQRTRHEERRWAHEQEVLALQLAQAAETAEANLKVLEAQGSWAGLNASLSAEASLSSSYKWVDAVRGLTRPFLTAMLWLVSLVIWFSAGASDRVMIVETATFAASAATLWWFGDRSAMRHRGN